jgi:hypothetical protein
VIVIDPRPGFKNNIKMRAPTATENPKDFRNVFEEIQHPLVFLGRERSHLKGREVGKRGLEENPLRQIPYFTAIRRHISKQAKRNFPIEGLARQSRNPKNT